MKYYIWNQLLTKTFCPLKSRPGNMYLVVVVGNVFSRGTTFCYLSEVWKLCGCVRAGGNPPWLRDSSGIWDQIHLFIWWTQLPIFVKIYIWRNRFTIWQALSGSLVVRPSSLLRPILTFECISDQIKLFALLNNYKKTASAISASAPESSTSITTATSANTYTGIEAPNSWGAWGSYRL